MANPLSGAAGALKTVPRSTWIIALGLGGGIGAIILIRNRNKTDTAPARVAGAETGLNYQQAQLAASPAITSGDYGGGFGSSVAAGDPATSSGLVRIGAGAMNLTDLLGAVGQIEQLTGMLTGGGPASGQVDRLGPVPGAEMLPAAQAAGNGGGPAYATFNPAVPVNQAPSAPTKAPALTPAQNKAKTAAAAAQAATVAQAARDLATAKAQACPSSHPNRSDRGCYRLVVIGRQRWHYYNNGQKVRVV